MESRSIICVLLVLMLITIFPVSVQAEKIENSFTFARTHPHSFQPIYESLFNPESLPLLGKLLTLFLREQNRGFYFQPIDDKTFSVQSGQTIKEESTLTLQSWNSKEFAFSAKLILEKIIKFHCQVEVKVKYEYNSQEIISETYVNYILPPVLNEAYSVFTFIIGHDIIEKSLFELIEELHALAGELEKISKDDWEEMSRDPAILNTAVFPLTFSEKEQEQVVRIIEDINNSH